ncbi:sporulation protein Cse60 [Lysinibacillus sp. NPDC094177]|uniref:sporulation protein Cse60 n=1 Tax=Lysinibacillus TaxID=400634 RepID=UPI003814E547
MINLNQVELITNEDKKEFQQEVNEFLGKLSSDQLIGIQYATTPTAIATHSEYGVYPSVEYSALIHYKK